MLCAQNTYIKAAIFYYFGKNDQISLNIFIVIVLVDYKMILWN